MSRFKERIKMRNHRGEKRFKEIVKVILRGKTSMMT